MTAEASRSQLSVSVVAPTHHRPGLLRALLRSLVAQRLEKSAFEVIIVGNEIDEGRDVVSEFADELDVRYCFVQDDPSRGRSPALKRNYGVEQARADWIAFIDDDCVADPGWLAEAVPFFANPRHGGVEGRKTIPKVDPPTLTYKGLLRFTRPQGYQTANMFYRRAVFHEVGGFDLKFPFYLEDTDLAWSVLERGFEIPFAERALVEHPVPTAEPMRLLANAQRAHLMPYLFRKHPERFRGARMRTVARSHYPYLLLYGAALASLVAGWRLGALALLGLLVPLMIAHGAKTFWGCRVTPREVIVTLMLSPIVPVVTLFQLLRGNVAQRVLLWR